MKKRLSSLLILSSGLILNPFSAWTNDSSSLSPDQAASVHFQESMKEELDKYKPSKITKDDARFLLQQIAGQDQKLAGGIHGLTGGGKGLKGAGKKVLHQTRHFPAEALVFYTAIGATMALQAYQESKLMDGRTDPRWLENLAHEITSPVGIFSFYCFLLASGQTGYLYAKGFHLEQKLQNIRSQIILGHKAGSQPVPKEVLKQHKKLYNWKLKLHTRFAGNLGLAMGIMASNIVTEAYYLTQKPAFKHCSFWFKKGKLNAQNDDLQCDLLADESFDTFRSWGPGILSVVTASILNTALTEFIITPALQGIKRGASRLKGKSAGLIILEKGLARLPFIKNLSFHISPGVLSKLKSIGKAVNFIPHPANMGRTAVNGARKAGQWTFKLFNLTSFMLIEQHITHKIYDPLNEWMHAGDLKDNIEDFSKKYTQINEQEEELLCLSQPEDSLNNNSNTCEYHPVIKSAHQTAQQFSQWRQYQSLIPMTAHNNWLLHINNAIGSITASAKMYSDLFLSSTDTNTLLNREYYFISDEDSASEYYPELLNNLPEEKKKLFQNALQEISKYKREHSLYCQLKPEDLHLVSDGISSSPSYYFLKPGISLSPWSEAKKACVLESLFKTIQGDAVSLFFKDIETALEKAKEIVKKTVAGVAEEELQEWSLDLLRKRVLSAGLELLHNIARQEQWNIENSLRISMGSQFSPMHLSPNQQKTADEKKAQNFFITLQEQMKVIKSYPRGEFYTEKLNEYYKTTAEQTDFKYHPYTSVGGFKINNMMDFMLSSFVCGQKPDLFPDFSDTEIEEIQNEILEQKKHWKEVVSERLPAFKNYLPGTDYVFYPPRAPALSLSDEEIDELCSYRFVQLSPSRPVSAGGRHYSNLLHLILDNIDTEKLKHQIKGLEELITQTLLEEIEEAEMTLEWLKNSNPQELIEKYDEIEDMEDVSFQIQAQESLLQQQKDTVPQRVTNTLSEMEPVEIFAIWWSQKVQSSAQLFLHISALEYLNMVRYQFPGPFFQNAVYEESLKTITNRLMDNESPQTTQTKPGSFWTKTFPFLNKRGWLEKKSFNGIINKSRRNFVRHTLNIPKGMFANLHFEMNYWADLIVNIVERKQKSQPDYNVDLALLKAQLDTLLKLYDVDFLASSDSSGSDAASQYVCHEQGNLIVNFFRPVQVSEECKNLYENIKNIAREAYCNSRILHTRLNRQLGFSEEAFTHRRGMKSTADENIGFFIEGPFHTNTISDSNALLDQLLKYSLQRLKDLTLSETGQYIDLIWPTSIAEQETHIFTLESDHSADNLEDQCREFEEQYFAPVTAESDEKIQALINGQEKLQKVCQSALLQNEQ